ncbi:MAG: hypothetical protein J4F28_08645 [Nitrosopumilaceae archaeon]|nr:hypothetical protein [Nitrosopumilaceae archaeon]
MDKPNITASEAVRGQTGCRTKTTTCVYTARGPRTVRRLVLAAAAWRMLRDALRPGVRVTLDSADYTCGACGRILSGDLRDASDHVYESHGRQSFTLEEERGGGAPDGV